MWSFLQGIKLRLIELRRVTWLPVCLSPSHLTDAPGRNQWGEHGDYSGPVVVSLRSPGARHGRRRDAGEDKRFCFLFESLRDVPDHDVVSNACGGVGRNKILCSGTFILLYVFPVPPTACLSPTLEFEEHMGLSFMYFHSTASNFTAFHAFSGGFLASEVTTFMQICLSWDVEHCSSHPWTKHEHNEEMKKVERQDKFGSLSTEDERCKAKAGTKYGQVDESSPQPQEGQQHDGCLLPPSSGETWQ